MKLKKTLSIITAAALGGVIAFGALACGGDDGPKEDATPENTYVYDIPQDYCRTYYEVFVRSFADSDGDGIGDLRGLADNLDYLNDGDDKTTEDLGINGIWMMPINASPSYHKYDVENYYTIDDEYGTLEDFDYLVSECNKRNIWLQMDLVLNHSSATHPWFVEAVNDAKRGVNPATSAAMQRYSFSYGASPTDGGTWRQVSGAPGYYYLGNFSENMPDINLNNEDVREEIKNIVDFWLERGIRSFRLDAVPWACANDTIYNDANGEFWTWFNNYCNEKGASVYGAENDGISNYCYNVGEVWTGSSTINDFFKTGMTNFNYSMAASNTSGFMGVMNERVQAAKLVDNIVGMQRTVTASDYKLEATVGYDPTRAYLSNFLTNHDNDRSAGYMQGDVTKIKKAASLYLLQPGNPYIYYGEEIGAMGSGSDPSKRMPFNWGDDRDGIEDPPGVDFRGTQRLGTWKSQTEDADSILTHYRRAIMLRNRFPEIGRGMISGYALNAEGKIVTMESLYEGGNPPASYYNINSKNMYVAAYSLTWGERTIFIAQNTGEEEITVDISALPGYAVVGELHANSGIATLEGTTLKLPGGAVALLKSAQ